MPVQSATNTEPVVVAGGGIGGLGAALALASRGYRSVVLEAHQNYTHVDRGDILHAASSNLLAQWGCPALLSKSNPLRFGRFRIIDEHGSNLLETDTQSLLGSHCSFLALKHHQIASDMAKAALDTGLVEIRMGERVCELLSDHGRVIGVRTPRANYAAALTVLAMGKRSALRDEHFKPQAVHSYGTAFFNACVKAIDAYRECGFYVLSGGSVMVLVPLPNDEMRIGIQYSTAGTERPSDATFAEIARQRLHPLRNENIELLEPGRTYTLRSALSPSWWIPGCVLLGDTAHVVHPVGGQGMNLALGDAEALAACIAAEQPSDESDFDRVAQRYADERREAVSKVTRRTHLMGLTANWRSPVLTTMRNTLIRATHHVPQLKRALMERVVDVR